LTSLPTLTSVIKLSYVYGEGKEGAGVNFFEYEFGVNSSRPA